MDYERIVRDIRRNMFNYTDAQQDKAHRIMTACKAKYVKPGLLREYRDPKASRTTTCHDVLRIWSALALKQAFNKDAQTNP